MIVTLDTNVLVYAVGPRDHPKCIRARSIVDRGIVLGEMFLLLQSLAEYSYVAIRKAGIPAGDVRRTIEDWQRVLPVEPMRYEDLPEALHAVARHRLAFWDAILWATARRIGARYFLTEDFQDGRNLEGVRFVNPFLAGNDTLIDSILPR